MTCTILTTSNPGEIQKLIAKNGGYILSVEKCDHTHGAHYFKFKCAAEKLDTIKSALARFYYFGF